MSEFKHTLIDILIFLLVLTLIVLIAALVIHSFNDTYYKVCNKGGNCLVNVTIQVYQNGIN